MSISIPVVVLFVGEFVPDCPQETEITQIVRIGSRGTPPAIVRVPLDMPDPNLDDEREALRIALEPYGVLPEQVAAVVFSPATWNIDHPLDEYQEGFPDYTQLFVGHEDGRLEWASL
jgi:hypothetical protein